MTPASGRFLLDTNIVIALLDGDDAVLSNLDRAPEVFIPAVALGELFFGAAKSGRPAENTAKVEQFAAGRPETGTFTKLRVCRPRIGPFSRDLCRTSARARSLPGRLLRAILHFLKPGGYGEGRVVQRGVRHGAARRLRARPERPERSFRDAREHAMSPPDDLANGRYSSSERATAPRRDQGHA